MERGIGPFEAVGLDVVEEAVVPSRAPRLLDAVWLHDDDDLLACVVDDSARSHHVTLSCYIIIISLVISPQKAWLYPKLFFVHRGLFSFSKNEGGSKKQGRRDKG